MTVIIMIICFMQDLVGLNAALDFYCRVFLLVEENCSLTFLLLSFLLANRYYYILRYRFATY